jgi:hypothetical protein
MTYSGFMDVEAASPDEAAEMVRRLDDAAWSTHDHETDSLIGCKVASVKELGG